MAALQEAGLWRYAATLTAHTLKGDECAAALERWAAHVHQVRFAHTDSTASQHAHLYMELRCWLNILQHERLPAASYYMGRLHDTPHCCSNASFVAWVDRSILLAARL